jgi:radical SAM-linked protein
VSFHGALPVGVESLCETMDVGLAASVAEDEVVSALNRVLPSGLRIVRAEGPPRPPKPPRVAQMVYQVESPTPVFAAATAADFMACQEFPVIRRRPKGERTVDVRKLVADLAVSDAHHLTLRLCWAEKDNLKVTELLGSIFTLTGPQTRDLHIVKVQVM